MASNCRYFEDYDMSILSWKFAVALYLRYVKDEKKLQLLTQSETTTTSKRIYSDTSVETRERYECTVTYRSRTAKQEQQKQHKFTVTLNNLYYHKNATAMLQCKTTLKQTNKKTNGQ